VLALAVALAAPGACARHADETDLLPPPGYVAPPTHAPRKLPGRGERAVYGEGFYVAESDDTGKVWHWTGKRAIALLPRNGRDKILVIRGGPAPRDPAAEPPTITITLGGQVLERFVGATPEFSRSYDLPGPRLGAGAPVALTIETSMTVRVPGDDRDLGVSITAIDWRDAIGPPGGPER